MTSSPAVAVRRRADADIAGAVEALCAVQAADGYPAVLPADPAGWISPRGMLDAWVARYDGVVAAHIALCAVDRGDKPNLTAASGRSAPELGEIKRLYVDPRFRGAGLAKRLLDAAAADARARGLHPVLEVVAGQPGPIALYERNGWRRVATYDADWRLTSGARPRVHIYELGAAASAESAAGRAREQSAENPDQAG
jgi:GNAT superfamily N-acetyltransferase